MGVLARLHQRRSQWAGPVSSWTDDKVIKLFGQTGAKTNAGITVTHEMAFTFSAVYDAVNQISSDVAKLPLNLHKRLKDGGSEVFDASSLHWLLKEEPNPESTAMDFRQTLTAHVLTCKGGFAEIERDGMGRPSALWIIEPHRIHAERQNNGPLQWRVDGTELLPDRDVIHIKGIGYDNINAYPLIAFARQAIGLALAAEAFSGSFFGNGLQYGGILTSEQPWDEEEAARAKAILEQMVVGPEAAHQLIALWGGMKLEKTGVEPDKAQMDATRSKQVEEVARFFNMPLHKLKSLERATNNNIEQQDLEYYKGCLQNWITKWEQELKRKLIPKSERRIQYFKHNEKAFLRGDAAARTALYSALLDRGVYNANQVLELEDMNPQPGTQGGLYLVQGAMMPKDLIQAKSEAEIKKAETPPAPPPAPSTGGSDGEREAVRVLEARLAQADAALAEALAQADAALARAVDAETNIAVSRAERAVLDAESDRQQGLIARLDAIRAGIETDLVEARHAATEAQTALAAAEREKSTLIHDAATGLATVAAQRDEAEQRATVARADADRVVAELVAARATAEAADDAMAVLRHAATEAQTALAAAQADHQTAIATLAATGPSVDAAVNEAAAARRTAAEAHDLAQAATAGRAEALATAERLTNEALAATQRAAEALTAQAAATERAHAADLAKNDAEIRAAEAERLATDSQNKADTLQAQLAEAVEARATAERQAHAAERLAEDQLLRTQAVEAALLDVTKKVTDGDDRHANATAAVLTATRALISDVMRRMTGREVDRLRRAQASPSKLTTAIGQFYDDHRDLVASALVPALRVHLAALGDPDDPATIAEHVAGEYVAASLRDLDAVLATDPVEEFGAVLEKRLQQWERDRPEAVADRIFSQALGRRSGRTS